MPRLNIDGREFSGDGNVLVIAEIGVNHDGRIQRALELVEAAHGAGADAVKLQIFKADALLHHSAAVAAYQRERCEQNDIRSLLSQYELDFPEIVQIIAAIKQHGLIPLATPFSLADVETVERLNLPAVKIASPDLANRPLLEKSAELRKPLLVSTGAATMEEVARCVGWLGDWKSTFALLHCVSAYPVPADQANLTWMTELGSQFGVAVGYSDHTTELIAGAMAVGLGACVVEKHLTYDRAASGPDHAASADPKQFAQYVELIRAAEKLRGSGEKRVLEIERDVRTVSRQSLVLRRGLRAGQTLACDDLIVQRPGTGISAADSTLAIGQKAKRDIEAGTMLQWDMLFAA